MVAARSPDDDSGLVAKIKDSELYNWLRVLRNPDVYWQQWDPQSKDLLRAFELSYRREIGIVNDMVLGGIVGLVTGAAAEGAMAAYVMGQYCDIFNYSPRPMFLASAAFAYGLYGALKGVVIGVVVGTAGGYLNTRHQERQERKRRLPAPPA